MKNDDQLLWKQFLNGDKPSFEAIYTLYYHNLYEFGIRKTGDEELVKESMQALFVKLWINRANIRETDNIKYYLIAALKNTLLNASARSARLSLTGESNEEAFHLVFPPPAEVPGADEKSRQLLEALNQLTARQKEVIYLRYFEELPYEQIAELMDVSVKGIYKLNSRALEALKDLLDISKKDLLLLLAVCRIYLS